MTLFIRLLFRWQLFLCRRFFTSRLIGVREELFHLGLPWILFEIRHNLCSSCFRKFARKSKIGKGYVRFPFFFGWEENFPARLCRRCVRCNVCVCVCVRALFQFQWFSYFASRCRGWERQESERFCSVFELIAVFRTYDFFMNRWGDFHQWKSARWRWLEGGRGEIVMTSNFDGCYANPTIFSCH